MGLPNEKTVPFKRTHLNIEALAICAKVKILEDDSVLLTSTSGKHLLRMHQNGNREVLGGYERFFIIDKPLTDGGMQTLYLNKDDEVIGALSYHRTPFKPVSIQV